MILFCLVSGLRAFGTEIQDTATPLIPIYLQYWHDLISQQQAEAVKIDLQEDTSKFTNQDRAEYQGIKDALIGKVNFIRNEIEFSNLDKRRKILYLGGLRQLLEEYNQERRYGRIHPVSAPMVINLYEKMMTADLANQSVAPYVANVPYEVGTIVLKPFDENFGYQVARSYLLREYSKEHLDNFFRVLNFQYPDLATQPFVDTVIAKIARKYPQQVYDYATSYTSIGSIVRHDPDTLVQAIVQIGKSPNAIRLLPFVEYITNGTYKLKNLEKIAANDDAFYKLSVKTLIDMDLKELKGEHPIALKAMEANVKRRALKYIREVNDLHESPDPVRFACVNSFSAPEIYFLLVNGEQEIYTSSYVGLFDRMMQHMNPPKGDKLLMDVIFDHFRKFITLAAAYNTLNPFLNSMSVHHANLLMQKFVGNLQYSKGLEDAVDVADAFGSIHDSILLRDLQHEVNENYAQMVRQNDVRGKVIYGLLASLFNTRESSTKDEVWSKNIASTFDLPPIDYIPFKNLENDSGIVYEEVFFYGDKDGFDSFNSFLTSFRDRDWRISDHKYWLTIRSTKGKRIIIYAKKPQANLDEDDKGMAELSAYLQTRDIRPTVYIHRGHSYHVNSTIKELQSSAKLVMLGSCGGYNSIAGVLNVSPDAQIIASKQTGSMYVNEPIIKTIEQQIRLGKDLDWINLWSRLSKQFQKDPKFNDLFQDYIPPQKNMGAIFIKAYKKLMKEDAPVDLSAD